MARVLIGNFKGPKGDNGEKGDPGPQGPKGEQGSTGLVNADGIIEFEDYLEAGAVLPTPEEALAGIASGMSLKSVISNIKAFLKVGGTGTEIISDKFSENKDYVVGDYAIRDNTLYRFVLDKAVGKWDETAVEPTTVGAEFQNLNAKMDIIMDKFFPETPFIYKNGDECPDITGGWIGSASGGAATKSEDHLYLASTNPMGPSNSYHAQFYTVLKIDMSDYKYLHIDGYYSGNSGVLFLSNEKFDFTYSAMNTKPVAKWSLPKDNRANTEYDISELQGEYYIGLATALTGSNQTPPKAYCYHLWMSK